MLQWLFLSMFLFLPTANNFTLDYQPDIQTMRRVLHLDECAKMIS